MKIIEIKSAGLRGKTPEGGWTNELRPDDCVHTLVAIYTDEGITGVGETRMLGHTDALIGYLREAEQNHILGSDPFAVEDLTRRMKYGDYGRAGNYRISFRMKRHEKIVGAATTNVQIRPGLRDIGQ